MHYSSKPGNVKYMNKLNLKEGIMLFQKKKDPVEEILDRYMDGEFALFACGQDAPSEGVIAEFEAKAGFRLPEDFRNFSKSSFGGIYIEVKDEIWPRPKPYEVGPFWSFLYGFFSYGFGQGIPDWMDIRIQTEIFRKEAGSACVPFLKIVGDADVYCFNAEGRICRWQHETGDFESVEESFLELFEREIKDLKERKEKKKAKTMS